MERDFIISLDSAMSKEEVKNYQYSTYNLYTLFEYSKEINLNSSGELIKEF
jgi:hypothetical protein